MNKKYLKMNDNNTQLSLGNFCRIIKEQSLNKTFAGQTEIFCTIFNLDTANDSTINNYCIGCRSISSIYKEQYQNNKRNYQQNKNYMLEIILNLTSILDGYIYTDEYKNINFLNNNINLKKICTTLYNLAKNDTTVPSKFTEKINNLLKKNTYYECINEIIFYIILEKKQPIYIETIVKETIEDILTNTNISLNDLESFLKLQFRDGTNYIYSLKQLAKKSNPYACLELGMLEYTGEITGTPRYNKSYDYLKTAANYNHPRANYIIAKMLLDQKIGNNQKENINLAWKYLQTASNLGSIAALNTIGLLYLKNNKDEKKAIEYFKKATKHNYVYAYNNLGKIYETKKEYKKAFEYYVKSANLEECWACNKIGEMYRQGLGTPKNQIQAFQYYNLALEIPNSQASAWAKYNLAKHFYLNGNYEANIEKDENKVITYLTEASNKNLIEATIELLYFYSIKYFKNKNQDILTKINNLITKIENHPNFNSTYNQEIEQTISQLKNIQKIDRTIFNDKI